MQITKLVRDILFRMTFEKALFSLSLGKNKQTILQTIICSE